jgi:hypothetical protein
MLLVGTIVGVLVVLLAIAAVFDRRSRRVRGRVGQVRVPGGGLGRNIEAAVGLQLSQFDAGQPMVRHTRNQNEDQPTAD